MISFYALKYPLPAKQLTLAHFADDGIDLVNKTSKDKFTPTEQLAIIRGQLLSTKVWLIENEEDLTKLLAHLSKFDIIAYDTETTNPNKFHFPDVLVWSVSVKESESFVIPYHFNKQMAEFLTTTEASVVAHNMKYDNQLLHHMTGTGPSNPHCTLLLEYCYVNDSALTPSLSLKNIAKPVFGSWAEDVTDLTTECIHDETLLYYAGIDACACLWVFNKYKADREVTPHVDLFDVYPMVHPKERSYSRYWFYQNVARQLSALTLEFTANGIHFDRDKLQDLDTKLEDIINNMYAKVRDLPTVIESWEAMRNGSATSKSEAYRTAREEVIANATKIPSYNNVNYINKFVETHHPELVKPSSAKNWTYTVLKALLGPDNLLALAIKSKDLNSLHDSFVYFPTFEKVDEYFRYHKQQEELAKCSETALNQFNRAITDFDFKVFSSAAQKKYILNNGFNISSSEKSSNTGEDSFNRKELERILNAEPPGEARDYIQFCVEYSQAAIIKNNFIKNILGGMDSEGYMFGSLKLGGTKSFRPSSGGGSRDIENGELGAVNLLNMPSGGNPFAKAFKKCITVPDDEWVHIGVDYSFLEENIIANITEDKSKVNILSNGLDSHCYHAPNYFPRIEEILGPNDNSKEWNKAFKQATKSNSELDSLRQASKPISFSLAYLSGITGLFRPVGWTGDTFENTFRFRDYSYTDDLEERTTKQGKSYLAPAKGAMWYDVEEYFHLDPMYHDFFEQAVVPAKRMHYNYHNKMYADIAGYRHEVIIAQAKKYKNVHGMLGLYANQTTRLSNGAIRTVNNFQFQSGSMLTIIAGEKIRRRCVEAGISKHVLPAVSIYDSLYYRVRRDADLINQFATIAKPILVEDFIVNQKVKLEADLEVSLSSWADFVSLDDIPDLHQYLKDN